MDGYTASRGKSYTRPALNSNVSPLRGGANAPLILLTAMLVGLPKADYSAKPLLLRLARYEMRPRSGPVGTLVLQRLGGLWVD